jgi:hypothetical protein
MSPLLKSGLLVASLAAAASASFGTVYFENSGNKEGWPNYPQTPQNKGRIVDVTSPAFSGSTAIMFEQTYVVNATERFHSEVTLYDIQGNNTDRYYGLAIFLDPSWQLSDLNRDTWQQWAYSGGGPWLLARIDQDKIRVSVSDDSIRPIQDGAPGFTVTKGVWHRAVTRLKLGSSGMFEFWWDGAKKWSVSTPITIPSGSSLRWSTGEYTSYWYDHYRSGLPSGYQTVRRLYGDQYRVASSYAEADPGAWGGGGGTVAAPTFNPPGGSFTTPQTVAISTTTPGATIHYTTGTGTPTTTYTGPITVSSTTTIRANASAAGLTDSSISSATYTIGGSTQTLSFEAESLARTTSGVSATTDTDSAASGGARVTLNAVNTGSWVEFTLPNIPAGTYSLRLGYKSNNNRGTATTRVDGTTLSGTLDQYAASASYPTATLGTVTFSSAGNHLLRLVVAGQNSASSGFTLSADKITLVGQ